MTAAEDPPVAPPFAAVPQPEEATEPSSRATTARPGHPWPRVALLALVLVAAGFGQGMGVTWLFDKRDERLSAAPPEKTENVSLAVPAATPQEAAPAHEAAPQQQAPGPAHELDVARERFALGDIEGARRVAAAFLLRLDGLGHADNQRAADAYALLGDVLRREYEQSLADAEGR
ncbi:MAG: hypothetical protein HY812_12680 [Planctomycetes bacterium]|nr:hypothetical protein [Planctomycetota bacterium]